MLARQENRVDRAEALSDRGNLSYPNSAGRTINEEHTKPKQPNRTVLGERRLPLNDE